MKFNITSIISMKYVNHSWQMTKFLRVDKCSAGNTNFSVLINELMRKPCLLFIIYTPFISKGQWDFENFYCFLQSEAQTLVFATLISVHITVYQLYYAFILYPIARFTNSCLYLLLYENANYNFLSFFLYWLL